MNQRSDCDEPGSGQYFEASPSAPSAVKDVVVGLVQPPLRLATDRGVFSHGKLDAGTELLLRQAPPPPGAGVFLDLGTGSGVIALALARRSPAARVIAIDINERARALATRNALSNGLANVDVLDPADVDPTVRFDLIWSNPPIRIGKVALHDLLLHWLDSLAALGTAVLVVHKHLGSDSLQRWLTDHDWPCQRVASSRGYRLLRINRPAVTRAADRPPP